MSPTSMFSRGQGGVLRDNNRYLGFWVRVIPGALAANTDIVVNHGLRTIPRWCEVKDAGTGFVPRTRRSAAWTASTITIQLDTAVAAGQNLLLFIA